MNSIHLKYIPSDAMPSLANLQSLRTIPCLISVHWDCLPNRCSLPFLLWTLIGFWLISCGNDSIFIATHPGAVPFPVKGPAPKFGRLLAICSPRPGDSSYFMSAEVEITIIVSWPFFLSLVSKTLASVSSPVWTVPKGMSVAIEI